MNLVVDWATTVATPVCIYEKGIASGQRLSHRYSIFKSLGVGLTAYECS